MRILIVILALMMPAILPVQAAGPCDAAPTSLADPQVQALWNRINQERSIYGPPFVWSDSLARSAAWQARDRAALQTTSNTDIDSLGRTVRVRATDCGYRTDALTGETAVRLWVTDPTSIYNIWWPNDTSRWLQIIRSGSFWSYPPSYQGAAIGRAYDPTSGATFWVLDVGGLPDTSVPPPAPTATPTPVPPVPTATPVPPSDEGWTYCAEEGQYCGYDLERQVRYGTEGNWAYRTQSGGIPCTNDVFGDPAYGMTKHCDYGPPIIILPPPPPPTATPRPVTCKGASWKCR